MKYISVFLISLLMGLATAQADNLLPYIEQPIKAGNLLTFSDQGVSFKLCDSCNVIRLRPDTQVEYLENGEVISFQQATELYVTKGYEDVSVFYTRSSLIYDRVSFGDVESINPHTIQQAQ